jgi:hypothetical protein
MEWFAEVFPQTELWRSRRGFVAATVENGDLPAALLEHFDRPGGDPRAAVIDWLEFVATGRVSPRDDGSMGHAKDGYEARPLTSDIPKS